MNINFIPLAKSHFPLLLKWLETAHVKAWWDQDVKWTPASIHEKYTDYVKGYKLENGVTKPISAHIICVDNTPVGYIQIYNAYDFARSKPLIGLPSCLAAFDVYIGEENYLKQDIGSQAIAQFLKEHGDSYTHIFADPNSRNLAAIRTYEKVGFKKIKEQSDIGEVWMIREQTRHPDPLRVIQKLIQERYSDAKAVFWAGSVSQNQGTSASDLDLVIIFDSIPFAYREAFIYDEWPIDAFVHDMDTLRYFFEESRAGNGISGLVRMILNGREVTEPSSFAQNIKTLAQEILKTGPATWDKKQIDKERFFITDVLEDIKYSAGRDEQVASAAWLFEALGQFYFRSQNKWCASGKSLIRYLKNDNLDLAAEFTNAFESLFQTGNSVDLELLVRKILAPYGGLFWDGFISDAPKESRIVEVVANTQKDSYIIYLIGKPGTGKYTIAQELAKLGFIVCDNQLINNPIFTLLNYDGFGKIPEFGWDAIGRIRRAVFDFISIEQNHNYVLTNCLYEDEGDRQCYSQAESMALKRGSLFVPVKLLISEEEHLRRIAEPSRRVRWKSIDPQDVYQTEPLITIEHPHLLELDVSPFSAAEVAEKILKHIKELRS